MNKNLALDGLPWNAPFIDVWRRWRGDLEPGKCAHLCLDWDGLPIDEHSPEWPCVCAAELIEQAGDENRA